MCCWGRTRSLVINKQRTAPENSFHDLNCIHVLNQLFLSTSPHACSLFDKTPQSANHGPSDLTLDISFLALFVLIPKIIIFYAFFLRQMKEESMSKLSIHWWLFARYEGHIEYSNSLFEKRIACCRTMLSLTDVAFSLNARFDIEMILWRHCFESCILALQAWIRAFYEAYFRCCHNREIFFLRW